MRKGSVRRFGVLAGVAMLAVPLVGAPPAGSAGTGTCTGTYRGVTFPAGLVVPEGQGCSLVGAVVQGDVHVRPGAHLGMHRSEVTGSVSGVEATVQILNTTVGRNVRVTRPEAFPSEHGFFIALSVRESHIGGSMTVVDAQRPRTGLGVEDSSVGGNLVLHSNRTIGFLVDRVAVGGGLICHGNDAPPHGSGNVARYKTGQCAGL